MLAITHPEYLAWIDKLLALFDTAGLFSESVSNTVIDSDKTNNNAGRLLLKCQQLLRQHPKIQLPEDPTTTQHISFLQYYERLQQLQTPLGHTDFFVQLGGSYDLADLGLLGYALLNSESLASSWLLSLGRNSPLYHPLSTDVSEQGDSVCVTLNATGLHPDWRKAMAEEWLFGTWRWLCQRLPELADSRSLCMTLQHAKPDYVDSYAQVFPGVLKFQQAHNTLSFERRFFHQRLSSAAPGIADLCLEQYHLQARGTLIQRLRALLLQHSEYGYPTLEQLAQQVNMTPHTLHRRLRQSGSSYRLLLLEVRMALAKHYLCNTDLPLQEIAYLLAYQHVPSFNRACRAYHGKTPKQIRETAGQQ